MERSASLEEGEIRELAPNPIPGTLSPWGASETSYYVDDDGDDDDDDSVRSSRLCTPPGLSISKTVQAPRTPSPRVMPSSSSAMVAPGRPSLAGALCGAASLAPIALFGSSPECDRSGTRWVIPPDVYREAESALARVAAAAGLSGELSGMHYGRPSLPPAPKERGSGADDPSGLTDYEQQEQQEQAVPQPMMMTMTRESVHEVYRREPPQSPLPPDELERAIGIIEDLFVVNGVPPQIFIQCGVSPGTLYHAFNRLGLKLPDELW